MERDINGEDEGQSRGNMLEKRGERRKKLNNERQAREREKDKEGEKGHCLGSTAWQNH